EPPASSSASTGTSSAKKLSEAEKENVNQVYENMKEKNMWTLRTGTVVEKVMRKAAMDSQYEHPVHSVIFDPKDPMWNNYFTKMNLMRSVRKTDSKSPHCQKNLKISRNLSLVWYIDNDLYQHACKKHYHPKNDSDLSWMQHSTVDALLLLFHDYLKEKRSETDLIRRVWTFIDRCFDPCPNIVVNSGELTSKTTSKGRNKDGAIDGANALSRTKMGTKVDPLFSTQMFEIGAMEAGAVSDRSSTKTHTKCPKTLKDMLVEMERANPFNIQQYKVCGFILSGSLFLQFVVLDCPKGHVCRVTRLPDWLPYPTSAGLFAARFFPYYTLLGVQRSI
ncbi:hypothetical protein BDA99DRAFT_441498, partial [Phascolomyces articulosus]